LRHGPSLARLFSSLIQPHPPRSTLFPYTTLFRSRQFPLIYCQNRSTPAMINAPPLHQRGAKKIRRGLTPLSYRTRFSMSYKSHEDRKSTRLNSSHVKISYAVFCLKKKKHTRQQGI